MSLMQTPPGAVTRIDGREFLYFAGTGYLGLQGHPEVVQSACVAAAQYGIGSANSRTAFGTTQPVLDVERCAAQWLGFDEAFYFASGWMGNHILMQSLNVERTVIFIDECSHYSLFEAAQHGRRSCVCFRHCDVDDLQEKLADELKPGEFPVVLCDGVFAATGRIAPIERYTAILAGYPGSVLCIDDAHGLAVLGATGCGSYEHAGLLEERKGIVNCKLHADQHSLATGHRPLSTSSPLPSPALLFCGTLSKAVGGYGGIIPGNREFIARLKTHSPYTGGASPPPPMIAAATAKAMQLVMANPDLQTRLHSNAFFLKQGLRRLGFGCEETPVPIVALTIGDAANMQRIQRELMAQGIAVAYMASYAGLGPEGALRIAVFATHTEEMIGNLIEQLRRLV